MDTGQVKSEEKIKKERDKLLQKAKKIKAVVDRGTPEEQANINNAYHEFLNKHGLTEEDVDGIINDRVFTIQEEDDALVLTNVILSINPTTKVDCTELYVKCVLDDEDHKEVIEKFRVFIKAWRKHKNWAIMCFMTKYDEYFRMDKYAYEKFIKANKPKNEDIIRAEEEDSKMNQAVQSNHNFEDTDEMIERKKWVALMNRVLPFMPPIFYERKHGETKNNKKPELLKKTF